MITQATIDKIFSAIRVEEVVGEYVQLKKAGSNYKGLSPFHEEKTPSFVVSPSKQIWKDFSTGKGGTAVSFLMEIENFSYPEALRFLAKKYGIEVEEDIREISEEEKENRNQKDLLYKIHEVAQNYFQEQLYETEEGRNIGLSYFRERGLDDLTLKKFQLGYSPENKSAFTQYALEKGYDKDLLEKSGLSIFPENAPSGIDRFRERVIFPILSFSGRVLGFGARILKSNIKTAKYLNSPETEIYHKSNVLYGISQSKQSISRENQCLLVEGYMDVISLHQAGIENVVASSGTALTKEQIKLIKRLTPNVTLLFDGDAAGIKASFRSIDLLLEAGMNIKVMLFPDGHDPDSFAKSFPQDYVKKYIQEHSVDFIHFKINVLQEEADTDPFKRAELIKEVVKSIAFVPNLLQQEIFVQQAAGLLHVSEQNLFNELQVQKTGIQQEKPQAKPQLKIEKPEPVRVDAINPLLVLEEKLVELMLKYGDKEISILKKDNIVKTTVVDAIIHHFEEDDYKMISALNQKIVSEIAKGLAQDEIRSGNFFLSLMDEDLTQKLSDALIDHYQLSNWKKHNIFFSKEEEVVDKMVYDIILRHKREYVMKMIKDLQQKIKEEPGNDVQYYAVILKLAQLKIELDKVLYRVL
ncbi:DNA primase [Elizabethkingia sp. JS20170427COW]|uniref:DNA primase n=1 Tax=Elizabethkingia sp. JS20170427COW TaxID=2583851 RepID=UPI0011102F29|nr:DNA primase [Elizabethkingia sp. JS20170427COW]QCX53731.1 DNA primase [Elizabethkingia sp. JS20170427COW]